MTRAIALYCLCAFAACGGREDSSVTSAPPGLVEISLGAAGDRVTFMLPDAAWRRDELQKGLVYVRDDRSLRVAFCFKESESGACIARARTAEAGAEIRDFEMPQAWPFVGVVVAYRGPPDGPMLDAFIRSFRYERSYACAFSFDVSALLLYVG